MKENIYETIWQAGIISIAALAVVEPWAMVMMQAYVIVLAGIAVLAVAVHSRISTSSYRRCTAAGAGLSVAVLMAYSGSITYTSMALFATFTFFALSAPPSQSK